MNWCSEGDKTEAERQRAQRQSELSEVRRNVRRGVLAFEWNWAEVGLVLSQTVRFAFFFFFFWISAWIGWYGRFRPKSAQFRANRPESKLRWRESAKTTWDPCGTTRLDARAAASPACRLVPLRRTRVWHPWCRVRAS